tara:strand:- start:1689 stop:2588 length:900 start_codon:yes stop_codon:yes gene_type:complete
MSLKVKNISKEFYSNTFFDKKIKNVLKDVSFDLKADDIFGITGPNGAGKTTLFKIILDLIEPSKGKVNIADSKNKYLAYINTNVRSFYWRLTPRDNLIFYGRLLNMNSDEIGKNINDLSKKFDVIDLLETPFMKLSSGQMQTFIIIRSLIKKPDFLFFDEATSSMDFQRSIKVLNIIKDYINENQIPSVWCSHNLDEIEFLCNRFSILKKGDLQILTKDEFKELKYQASMYCFEILKKDLAKLPKHLKYKLVSDFKNTHLICFQDETKSLNDTVKILIKNNIKIHEIVNRKNMRDFSFE